SPGPPPPASYPLSLHDALPISSCPTSPRCGTPTPPRSSSSRPLSPAAPPPAWMRPTARSPWRSPTPPSSPCAPDGASHADRTPRSEEHTSELQSRFDLVCRLLL